MRKDNLHKLEIQAEVEKYQHLFLAEFDVLWNRLDLTLKQACKYIAIDELERLSIWWIYCWVAEIANSVGINKTDFLEGLSKAFDEIEEVPSEKPTVRDIGTYK